jgi:hypothetical protein
MSAGVAEPPAALIMTTTGTAAPEGAYCATNVAMLPAPGSGSVKSGLAAVGASPAVKACVLAPV